MNIKVIKGNMNYINDCEDVLVNLELGKRYFLKEGSVRKLLEEGIIKGEIYIVIDNNNSCKGFIWIILNGVFYFFFYIYMFFVKSESCGYGIGKRFLNFVESFCCENYLKLFLVVGDFNLDVRRLYERIGYFEIGDIFNLYRNGIIECLMMKLIE